MGFLDDLIGGKHTIQISNIGLILACIIAVLSPNRDLFNLQFPMIGDVMITGKIMFWISGALIGTFSGPNQSASRSLMTIGFFRRGWFRPSIQKRINFIYILSHNSSKEWGAVAPRPYLLIKSKFTTRCGN